MEALVDGINGSADLAGDALLQQPIYNEVYSMLVSEYFDLLLLALNLWLYP